MIHRTALFRSEVGYRIIVECDGIVNFREVETLLPVLEAERCRRFGAPERKVELRHTGAGRKKQGIVWSPDTLHGNGVRCDFFSGRHGVESCERQGVLIVGATGSAAAYHQMQRRHHTDDIK